MSIDEDGATCVPWNDRSFDRKASPGHDVVACVQKPDFISGVIVFQQATGEHGKVLVGIQSSGVSTGRLDRQKLDTWEER